MSVPMRFMKAFFLFLLIIYCSSLLRALEVERTDRVLAEYVWESEKFRAMDLGEEIAAQERIDYEELAFLMAQHDFVLDGVDTAHTVLRFPLEHQAQIMKLADTYRSIFQELKCFPIPDCRQLEIPDIEYENGWMDERSYGGEHGHEGCDLMAEKMPAGFYPVVSMTDGVVEKMGWLPKGGYRIGIRAAGGAYVYYAHLDRYADMLEEGDTVFAGELLGFVGDSGYGEEGTRGQFPPHLHLGIYIRTEHYEELSVNPYWILRYMEQKRTGVGYERK